MLNEEQVVMVRSFGYRHEGEFARSALESAGIECVLRTDDAGGAQAGLSFSNPAQLFVRQGDLGKAQDVLQEHGLLN